MKLKLIFLCILLAQTSASFFDEFRGAMSTVENSFEKLLGDVVTDVQETIGCTILAVKQVLALGGIFNESSDYDTRCRGINNGKDTSTFVQEKDKDQINPPSIFQSDSNEKPSFKRVSEEMDKSVSNVHNTMLDLINKNDAYENIVKAEANIVHERDRLSEISALLRRELSTISDEVKRELSKVESNSDHSTIDGIWRDVKALHEIQLSHKNTPEATEIRRILNEVVRVLHSDEIQNTIPLMRTETVAENESNDAFLEIESQFEKMEQEHDDKNNFENSDVEDSGEIDLVQNPEFPLTFKSVAKKIMDETSRTFRFADGSSQHYEHVVPTTTEKPISTEKYDDYPERSSDYNSFFQLAPKDSPAHKEAVQEAKNLIEKSKKTDAIINDYFKKTDKVGTSVFDDPDLLEFA